ncbi:MAG: DUF1800 domain-containing protein [Hyphomonadaceae bacterium]|nr:DUF1800 domain-containing protein [Hyphomonadaceae bacterium]
MRIWADLWEVSVVYWSMPKSARAVIVLSGIFLSACSGGGGSSSPAAPSTPQDAGTFSTEAETARFLTQATFGPTPEQISSLTGTSASDWIRREFRKSPSRNLQYVLEYTRSERGTNDSGNINYEGKQSPSFSFWVNAVEADDQLRQRMAFALSEILVISHGEGGNLFDLPVPVADYQDILVDNAFGNYRELLEDVTYSPAMAIWLTYLRNRKANNSGRMPDENYAREVMQLFTIGLVELNPDGTARSGTSGEPIQTYDNSDVVGLAKVFTGLSIDQESFWRGFKDAPIDAQFSRLKLFPEYHSEVEKAFLGTVIPENTSGEESISAALDALFNHENLPPFVSRQLIQRFVTSDPSPAYVQRVAEAFIGGSYQLPDGSRVGDGRRGSLEATIAAVLFDDEARGASARARNDFGKIREPILRFTSWARAFDAGDVRPQDSPLLWNTGAPQMLGQHPYKSPSVFNFYRPGYVAPGTESGAAGLTVPELQITNASSVAGYTNFMTFYAFAYAANDRDPEEATSFIPDYGDERLMADDPQALVDHLSLVLAYDALPSPTRQTIVEAIDQIPLTSEYDDEYDGELMRISLATLMVMTSPEYIVQR